jgi:hypothetical protein
MTRSQEFLTTMLHRLPKWELSSYEHQAILDKIRDRLTSTNNVQDELRRLYAVKNYSEFAMGLMWIAEKAEQDAQKYNSTPEEDELIFSLYRKAVGEGTVPTVSPSFEFTSPTEEPKMPLPVEETIMNPPFVEPASNDSIWGDLTSFSNPVQEQPSETPVVVPRGNSFSVLLDQVLEAIQSGSEERTSFIDRLVVECKNILADANTPEDCRSFCQPLQEFLDYVLAGQLIDDIRVMNIISNIQGPFAQWEQTEQGNRAGILDGAIDILRDFKTMFE